MKGNVVSMLDGVDEIIPDYMKLVLNLHALDKLNVGNFEKILIAMKPHSIQVKKIVSRALFLTNYWAPNANSMPRH